MIASVAVRPAVTDVPIEQITARAYSIPTEQPESDGTATWDQTTIVVVEATAAADAVSVTPTATKPSPR